jgi:hypothetical protein
MDSYQWLCREWGRHEDGFATATLLLHGSPRLGGFSYGRFTPGSAQEASLCSRGALQGLDGAWEVVRCCGGNGARAWLLGWGKVVVGAMGGFFYRSRSLSGWGTMPLIQIQTESRISLRVHCGFNWISELGLASTPPAILEISARNGYKNGWSPRRSQEREPVQGQDGQAVWHTGRADDDWCRPMTVLAPVLTRV